jgi:excisionase family DNA binding protein
MTQQLLFEVDRLLTKKDLAERLRISTRSIDRKIRAEELPRGLKLGSLVRWRESDLAQWISEGCPRVAK